MITTVDEYTQARTGMVDQLIHRGALTDPAWIDVFRQVPRHAFLPAGNVHVPGGWRSIGGCDDGETHTRWLETVYSDEVIVVAFDDAGIPTSSSTQPSLMAEMLEALRVADGMNVLEIGAGVGYNAALLAARLGAEHVTTVDIQPDLLETARRRLATAGYPVTAVCSDGLAGHRERAPYDRLIATCGVRRVPGAWIEQMVDGGVILASVGLGLARLTVTDGIACGRFLPGTAGFMRARQSPIDVALNHRDVLRIASSPAEHKQTATVPAAWRRRESRPFTSLLLPRVDRVDAEHPDGTTVIHLVDTRDESWARVTLPATGDATVEQGGNGLVWDRWSEALLTWEQIDRPAIDRFGLTVTTGGANTLWLDEPTGRTWSLLP